eukprot:m.1548267 g.1548267  ORF g.1548267 m.1548267 type:complete len:410 (-) comp25263_c0_seq18:4183-5412(-)
MNKTVCSRHFRSNYVELDTKIPLAIVSCVSTTTIMIPTLMSTPMFLVFTLFTLLSHMEESVACDYNSYRSGSYEYYSCDTPLFVFYCTAYRCPCDSDCCCYRRYNVRAPTPPPGPRPPSTSSPTSSSAPTPAPTTTPTPPPTCADPLMTEESGCTKFDALKAKGLETEQTNVFWAVSVPLIALALCCGLYDSWVEKKGMESTEDCCSRCTGGEMNCTLCCCFCVACMSEDIRHSGSGGFRVLVGMAYLIDWITDVGFVVISLKSRRFQAFYDDADRAFKVGIGCVVIETFMSIVVVRLNFRHKYFGPKSYVPPRPKDWEDPGGVQHWAMEIVMIFTGDLPMLILQGVYFNAVNITVGEDDVAIISLVVSVCMFTYDIIYVVVGAIKYYRRISGTSGNIVKSVISSSFAI